MNQDNISPNKIFWFVVYLATFGMGFTIYLLTRFKGEVAERFADQAMIFWLTTAVGGGIGYLIGSSMHRNREQQNTAAPGTTKTDISATVVTETKAPEEVKKE